MKTPNKLGSNALDTFSVWIRNLFHIQPRLIVVFHFDEPYGMRRSNIKIVREAILDAEKKKAEALLFMQRFTFR